MDFIVCDTVPEKDARIILNNTHGKNMSWIDCRVVRSINGDHEWRPRAFSLEQQTAQLGIHQSARHFTSWHNMSNPTIIPDSKTLFAFLGELVTAGVVLLVGCSVTCLFRTQASHVLSCCEAKLYSMGSAASRVSG